MANTRKQKQKKNSQGEPNKGSVFTPEQYDAEIAQYEKKVYDLQQQLEICRSLCTTLEFSTLVESILYIVMAQMRVLGAGLFVLEALDSMVYSMGLNYSGIEPDATRDYSIMGTSPIISVLSKQTRGLTLQELKEAVGPDCPDIELLESLHPTFIVPLNLKNRVNGILVLGEHIIDEDYTEYEKSEVYIIASLAAIAVNSTSLVEQSSTDMMTHLKLKYYFFNMLTDRLDEALSSDKSLSVIMFDIDFFKKFNDTYGHACGDYVLQAVARIIKNSIRGADMASRYGGEEFTVMLLNASAQEAVAVAERIRKRVETFDFFYEDQHMKVTISGGVAEFNTESNPITSAKLLVDQADQALYISKRSGRNRITFADPSVISSASNALNGK